MRLRAIRYLVPRAISARRSKLARRFPALRQLACFPAQTGPVLASARFVCHNLCRLGRRLASRDTCSRDARAKKRLVNGRLCGVLACNNRKRGAATREAWGWGAPKRLAKRR